MKTTLDLPDALVKQVKLRALQDGRKLKDVVADLLRKGLAVAAAEREARSPMIATDKETGLPVVVCQHAAAPNDEMTPQRVADLLLDQEADWHHGKSSSV